MGRYGIRWATFVEGVCARFEELDHEDIVAEFDKLQEKDPVVITKISLKN